MKSIVLPVLAAMICLSSTLPLLAQTPTMTTTAVSTPTGQPVDLPFVTESAFHWVKSSDSDGIKIYWSKVEGSQVIAFKGEGIVDSPVEKVASVIIDETRGTEWIDSLLESTLVRPLSPTEFIEYDHVGTPFIMANRDFVSHVIITGDAQNRRVKVSYTPAEDPLRPPDKRYVRGVMTCVFKLQPMTISDETYVEAEIHCDPKGGVPKWLVNWFQQGWPQTTFENLRRQLKKSDIKILPVVTEILATPAVNSDNNP
jgi:hypothetical protein